MGFSALICHNLTIKLLSYMNVFSVITLTSSRIVLVQVKICLRSYVKYDCHPVNSYTEFHENWTDYLFADFALQTQGDSQSTRSRTAI
jgi:hypothetical protein